MISIDWHTDVYLYRTQVNNKNYTICCGPSIIAYKYDIELENCEMSRSIFVWICMKWSHSFGYFCLLFHSRLQNKCREFLFQQYLSLDFFMYFEDLSHRYANWIHKFLQRDRQPASLTISTNSTETHLHIFSRFSRKHIVF